MSSYEMNPKQQPQGYYPSEVSPPQIQTTEKSAEIPTYSPKTTTASNIRNVPTTTPPIDPTRNKCPKIRTLAKTHPTTVGPL